MVHWCPTDIDHPKQYFRNKLNTTVSDLNNQARTDEHQLTQERPSIVFRVTDSICPQLDHSRC